MVRVTPVTVTSAARPNGPDDWLQVNHWDGRIHVDDEHRQGTQPAIALLWDVGSASDVDDRAVLDQTL
jgi:hypothetical protein